MKKAIVDYMRENLGLEGDLVDELIHEFTVSIQEHIVSGRDLLQHENMPELRRVGHTVKGTAANIGAEELRALGLQLEHAAGAGDTAECRRVIDELELTLARLK